MKSKTQGRVWDCNFRIEQFRPDTQFFGVLAEALSVIPGSKFLLKPAETAVGLFSTRFREQALLTAGTAVLKRLLPKVWAGAITEDDKELDTQADKEDSLIDLFKDAYRQMAKDEAFRRVHSAIPYCYAPVEEHAGHGFVYVPSHAAEQGRRKETPCIVFLHGSLGNLLWNIWALVAEFPDHIILAPSGGYEWPSQSAKIVSEYVDEMRAHVESKFNVVINRPWLMALSQGGPTGFKIAAHAPDQFHGYVSIASWANFATELRYPPDFPILMINGTNDLRVKFSYAEEVCMVLKNGGANITMEKLDGASHFFFLSRRAKMASLIRIFQKRSSTKTGIQA